MAPGAGQGTPRATSAPVGALAVGALCLIVAGGIYLAAHIPGPVSLLPAYVLLVAAVGLIAIAGSMLWRLTEFNWACFFRVGRWSLLAYLISAGMLEYVFVLDRVPRAELVLLTSMLVVYAVDIPLILAFTVARLQDLTT
ncbi:MAG: hypothetical protein M0027_07660 [Candidatus Dormibacteraeota bacterium]|nr:hypothetical protein [Candidatus Dormibacteraeota bacterium]